MTLYYVAYQKFCVDYFVNKTIVDTLMFLDLCNCGHFNVFRFVE